ncbi:hypothetical protein [Vagococcus hydrophili]|uniref:Lipoprotein n=1 Tax=Vagococcus hydrophili TaxID=2714947 RepID=A0A6G8AX69_9ENTE|nr:hypothetical protein [Vagococcus hydrophili]QIL49483.1 hypothetical protein G7082_13735 [Vagococcus hydrophili]
MKKRLVLLSTLFIALTLSACSKKEELKTNETKETVETTQKEMKIGSATFKGKLSETPIIDEDTIIMSFEKVTAIKDEEKLADMMNANGVVLLADMNIFDKDMKPEDFEVGSEIEFELETPTAMTYSIPPQVAGNSIKRISLVK